MDLDDMVVAQCLMMETSKQLHYIFIFEFILRSLIYVPFITIITIYIANKLIINVTN